MGDWEIQELQNGVQKELSASLHLCRKNSVLPCDRGQRNCVARIFKRNEGKIKFKIEKNGGVSFAFILSAGDHFLKNSSILPFTKWVCVNIKSCPVPLINNVSISGAVSCRRLIALSPS